MRLVSPHRQPLQPPLPLQKAGRRETSVGFGSNTIFPAFADPLTGQKRPFYGLTYLFRSPELYTRLVDCLAEKFPQGIDIHCFAASDGSEPISLAIELMEKLGEKASNFKITGFDIYDKAVEKASRGILPLLPADIYRFSERVKGPINQYFEPYTGPQVQDNTPKRLDGEFYDHDDNPIPLSAYRIKDNIQKQVTFKKADIRAVMREPQPKPVVVMFRNAWYQLGPIRTWWDWLCRRPDRQAAQACQSLAQDLYRSLPSKSLVVIGETEAGLRHRLDVPGLLTAAGFNALKLVGRDAKKDLQVADMVYEKP